MRQLLLLLPTPVLLIIVVGGSAVLAMYATHLIRQRFDERSHSANNEVAGFLFAAVGVVYGVLLAFMVLVVWQDYEDAQTTVENEANVLVDVFRLGQELPSPFDRQIDLLATRYAERVINDEWHLMEFGQESSQVDALVDQMWETHHAMHEAQVDVGAHDQQMFQAFQDLGNLRRIRLLASRDELPYLMWVLLIGGAVVTLSFTLFLRAPNYVAHLLMAGMFAGLVAFVLVLVIELDNPFTGDVSISPLAFQQALAIFDRLRPP